MINSFFKSAAGMCIVCIMEVANYLDTLENLFEIFLILHDDNILPWYIIGSFSDTVYCQLIMNMLFCVYQVCF